jgi:hypothetical protein
MRAGSGRANEFNRPDFTAFATPASVDTTTGHENAAAVNVQALFHIPAPHTVDITMRRSQ